MSSRLPWLVPAVALALSCAAAPRSDRLFVGGTVHLADGARRLEVAVKEGRIVALVEPAAAGGWKAGAAEVVDLSGAHLYPGFTEGHGHYAGYGAALEQVDLVGTRTLDEVVARVREAARAVPPGEWVRGRGWDQNVWPEKEFPDRDVLSAAFPDRPVLLRRVDGHAVAGQRRGARAGRHHRGHARPAGRPHPAGRRAATPPASWSTRPRTASARSRRGRRSRLSSGVCCWPGGAWRRSGTPRSTMPAPRASSSRCCGACSGPARCRSVST